jgi:lipopolysaccharide export system ATP-binding protein
VIVSTNPVTLEAHNIAKSFKGQARSCTTSPLTINQGQVVGLLGPNGAGKTTCFDMIVGQIRADKGKITLKGEDITRLAMHQRAKRGISYLPQQASIFRKLTVRENILAILEIRKELDKKARETLLRTLLEEFQIGHIRDSLGMSLSGGERRRAEIARALAIEPLFILLDEPFAGVDPISVSEIKKIILQLKEKSIGVLITDHDVRETLDICEKAYIVNAGKIIEEGNAERILSNPLVKEVYLGQQFRL